MAVVGEDDTTHGIEKHLEHGLGAEAGSDDISDTTSRGGAVSQGPWRGERRSYPLLGGEGPGNCTFWRRRCWTSEPYGQSASHHCWCL